MHKKGFTLIEILLIIVLLGLLAGTALTTFFNTSEKFQFISEYKPIISTIRQARNFAINNKRSDEFQRYGVEIGGTSVVLFGDAGVPYVNDDIKIERIDLDDPPFELFWDSNGFELSMPISIFYENGSGEFSAFANGTLIPKSDFKRLDFTFSDYVADLDNYFYIYQVSGILEESNTGFDE